MRTEIKCNENKVILSDEMLDNDAFIDISILDSESGDILTATVSIIDLMPALIAFDAKRSRRLSDESLM